MWFFIHNLDGFLWTSVTLLCPSLCSGAKPRRPSVSGVCCIPSWTLRKSPHLKMRDTNQIKSQIQGGNECRNVSQCVAMCRIWIWKKTFPGPTLDLPRTCAGPIDRRHKALAGSVFKAFTYGSRRSEIHCERCCKFYQWRKMSVAIYDPWMDVRWTPPKTSARNSHNQAAVLVRIQFFH
jgi:hypothetical protein